MKKLYQIFFIDEYNNAEELGWYEDPDDCIEELNQRISVYGDYKLQKGDIRSQIGTFSEYIGTYISDVLEERYGEEVYEDFQSCFVGGFVHCFDDEVAFNLSKNLLMGSNEKLDLSQESITLERIIELIEKGENRAILDAYNSNPLKFADNIMNGIIANTMDKLSQSMTIDLEKHNIDKTKIFDNEYWRMIEEDYDITNAKTIQRLPFAPKVLVTEDDDSFEADSEILGDYENKKSEYDFLGYYIFNLEAIEYYVNDEELITYLYVFYNEQKNLSQVLIAKKKNNVN